MNTAFSFKICKGEDILDYIIVETTIPDDAFDIAELWKLKQGIDMTAIIRIHHRRMVVPTTEADDVINNHRIWNLPF